VAYVLNIKVFKYLGLRDLLGVGFIVSNHSDKLATIRYKRLDQFCN